MKTYTPKLNEIEKKWYLVDARGKVLGRLASKVAQILLGKGKPKFTPHLDSGDYVVVINCDKVMLTGKKTRLKTYYHYTGYPGGLKKEEFSKLIKEKPEKVFIHSVKGMLPHNRLGDKILSKLFVYSGEKHPHQAQKPVSLEL
ncbi:MAG: 50S ribosomal protein L13 [candidate division Zixibacteria bacterium]|nr:50S ribosomal protein L13 [candidate division Zixibacteria bacterium]